MCIICQENNFSDALRCPALDNNKEAKANAYTAIVDTCNAYFTASGGTLTFKTDGTLTTERLLEKQAKWHRNCRRTLLLDRLMKLATTPETSLTNARVSRQSL